MEALLNNLSRVHTTPMGVERISRNIGIAPDDVVESIKKMISAHNAAIERKGKNYYIITGGCRITVNAHSYTIITAHKLKK